MTFFGKPSIIHHPRHYRLFTEHRRQYEIQTAVQDGLITPRGVGDHMMQRLMHTLQIVGS